MILHSHQQCVRFTDFAPPCQHLVLSPFQLWPFQWFCTAIYFIVILFCISLITSLLDICLLFLVNFLFKFFTHLFLGLSVLLNCENFFYILDICHLSDICFCKCFFQCVSLWGLLRSKNLILIRFNSTVFFIYELCFFMFYLTQSNKNFILFFQKFSSFYSFDLFIQVYHSF